VVGGTVVGSSVGGTVVSGATVGGTVVGGTVVGGAVVGMGPQTPLALHDNEIESKFHPLGHGGIK
jgi:hypothetical protein